MQHWKRTTEIANRLFQQGDLVDARELYLQALALAQVLFERWQDADEAVAACVISHHNLADLHLRLKQPQESAEYLCAIHQRLLQTCQDERLSPALREAAEMIEARAAELRGGHEDTLLWAARLSARYPAAALIRYKEGDTGVPARYARSIAYYQSKDPDRALKVLVVRHP